MRARRVVRALVLGAVLSVAGVSAAWVPAASADPTDTPSTNELHLKVDRMEHQEQAQVTGDAKNAMLFNTRDREALAAANELAAKNRQTQVGSLFISPAAPYWKPMTSLELFEPTSYSKAGTGSNSVDDDGASGSASTYLFMALGASVLVGAGIAYGTRERKSGHHGN